MHVQILLYAVKWLNDYSATSGSWNSRAHSDWDSVHQDQRADHSHQAGVHSKYVFQKRAKVAWLHNALAFGNIWLVLILHGETNKLMALSVAVLIRGWSLKYVLEILTFWSMQSLVVTLRRMWCLTPQAISGGSWSPCSLWVACCVPKP